MKKFLCLSLAGILLFSACGNKNESDSTTESTTETITSTTNELTETTHLSDTTDATEATEAPNPEGMGSGIKRIWICLKSVEQLWQLVLLQQWQLV